MNSIMFTAFNNMTSRMLFGEPPKDIEITAQQQVVLNALNAMSDKEWVIDRDGGRVCYCTVEGVKNPGDFIRAFNRHLGTTIQDINLQDAIVTIPVEQMGVRFASEIESFKVGSLLDKRGELDFQNRPMIFKEDVMYYPEPGWKAVRDFD